MMNKETISGQKLAVYALIMGWVVMGYLLIFSCSEPQRIKIDNSDVINYGSVQVIKIRGCEWALWINSSGCDMKHLPCCENPKHFKK